MNILLIFPRLEHGVTTYKDKGTAFAKLFANPYLSLSQVAACTPPGHTISIVDENYEKIDFDGPWDLVGITSLTMLSKRAYEIADKFRKRGIKVILGGYHPTAMPEEAKQHADAVVISEAEEVWANVISDVEQDTLQDYYHGSHANMDHVPVPIRDLMKFKPLTEGIQTSRGCPNACEFCSTTVFLGRALRRRPIDHVVTELRQIPNKVIIFRDASLTLNPKYSMELFKVIRPLNKKWIANGNINLLGKNTQFLQAAKKSGCISWFVGFESINPSSLKEAHKVSNKAENYDKAIKEVRKHGMGIVGGFIFGFDHDTTDIFDTTLDVVLNWDIDAAEFNILTPYPGTPLYDKLDQQKRIVTKDWTKYTQAHVVYKPKNMTPEELLSGTKKVIRKFYSPREILKRIYGSLKVHKFAPYSFSLPGINIAMRRYYQMEFFNGRDNEKLPPYT
jgi:radical SAM superfamily enzyme YgiQ (UPF0313 family)